ncbi:MAG: hypothetical protein PVG63_09290 [Anaerolineales bacterium]
MSAILNPIKKLRFLHPLLFSAFPVLSMFTANIGSLDLPETYRAFVAALLLAVVIFLITRWITKSWDRAALLTSPIMLCVFAYGHFYNAIEDGNFGGLPARSHILALGLWILILTCWVLIVKKIKEFEKVNLVLSAMAIVMISFPLADSFRYAGRTSTILPSADDALHIKLHWEGAPDEQPDIYFIILDGYARADTLESIYGYDNSDFLDDLRQRGFSIANHSYSNYDQTLLSLSSTLNLNYVQHIIPDLDPQSKNRTILDELIHHSQAYRLLGEIGYRLVAFETPLPGTTITEADVFWKPSRHGWLVETNYFEELLLYNSIFRVVLDSQTLSTHRLGEFILEPSYETHRARAMNIFERLADVNQLQGNHLVIAHIVAPHPPFVFGPHGERLPYQGSFTLNDGSHYRGTREEYIHHYRDQVIFVSSQILDTIDEILATADTPPIIILQADHGPGAYLDWGDIESTNLEERFAILNALYLPNLDDELLPSDLSPVNTFRVIFNAYFSTDLPLLANRSFFSGWDTPFDLTDVSSQLP